MQDGLDETILVKLMADTVTEMRRAYEKHGPQSMLSTGRDRSPGEKLAILVEEVGEVARAMTYDNGSAQNLREELQQVAAMALSWLHSIEAGGRE